MLIIILYCFRENTYVLFKKSYPGCSLVGEPPDLRPRAGEAENLCHNNHYGSRARLLHSGAGVCFNLGVSGSRGLLARDVPGYSGYQADCLSVGDPKEGFRQEMTNRAYAQKGSEGNFGPFSFEKSPFQVIFQKVTSLLPCT